MNAAAHGMNSILIIYYAAERFFGSLSVGSCSEEPESGSTYATLPCYFPMYSTFHLLMLAPEGMTQEIMQHIHNDEYPFAVTKMIDEELRIQ